MIVRESKPPRDYEVFDMVLNRGDAVELARMLSVSPQLIRSWCRPPETDDEFKQTGKFNPLSRLRTLVAMIKEDDGEATRAYPIGRYVAGILGGVFVPNQQSCGNVNADAMTNISSVLKETGEVIDEFSKAWFTETPRKITARESAQITGQINEAISALVTLQRFVSR
ncbi:MAG: hypothetical protein VR65_06080 [Desulfobulbaceae bacterium BRH_c16a]|nr:MAG: hypothetical protein VR65_06080 [Desulfobulbaceae bacterium BRH_c16a]